METKVINIRNAPKNWRNNPEFVYIGRAMPRQGIKASVWANPFKIGKDGDRDEVIEKYRIYIAQKVRINVEMVGALRNLQGKTLVCWCKPEPCHGDVLAEMVATTWK